MTVDELLKLDLQTELDMDLFNKIFYNSGLDFDTPITIMLNGKRIKTTVGIYVFNKFVLPEKIFEKDYFNATLNKSMFKKFINKMSDYKNFEKVITDEDFAQIVDRIDWLGQQTLKLTGGGITIDSISISQESRDAIKEILKDVDENSPLSKIEAVDNEIKAILEKELEGTYLGDIIASGTKGSITHIKMILGYRGMVGDKFIKSSVENATYEDIAQLNGLEGSYGRSVETQKGGYLSKLITAGLNHTRITKTKDCGTKLGLKLKLTKPTQFMLRYVRLVSKPNEPFEILTPENQAKYVGKRVFVRSPMFCKDPDGYCQTCYGTLNKINKIDKNLSVIVASISADLMNKSMKKFHNLEQSYGTVDFKELLLK